MKLTRDRLKRIIEEELEQEGFMDNLKAKIAPGMAAKSLAKNYGDLFVVNSEGTIDISPEYIKNMGISDFKRINDLVFKNTANMVQDENFQILPEKSKELITKYFEASKKGKDGGAEVAMRAAPPGSQFRNIITNIGTGKYNDAVAQGAVAQKEKERQLASKKDAEERDRRDRNDYEGRKNANLDAATASSKEKEKAAAQAQRDARDAEKSRAEAPYSGRANSFSSRETGNVRDAWEESKKSNKNIVKEGNNMKLTRDRLKKIIKEELEEMMGGMSAGAEQAYDKPATDQVKGRAKVHYGHISSAMENPKVPNLKNDQEYMKLRAYVNKQGVPDELEYKIFTDGSGQIGDEKFSKNLVNSLMLAGIYAGNQNF